MKKFLIILCCMSGMSAQAQTTMDYLTSALMWTTSEEVDTSFYEYLKFSRTSIIQGHVSRGKSFTGSMPFYLSDTEDTVFDASKEGKSERGRYIIIDHPAFEKVVVYRIEHLDYNTMTVYFNSKGETQQTYDTFTLYARSKMPPVPRQLFETIVSSKRYKLIYMPLYGNCHYYWPSDKWTTNIPEGQLPYRRIDGISLKDGRGYIEPSYYASTGNDAVERGFYDLLIVRSGVNLAMYKSPYWLSQLSDDSPIPGSSVLASIATNPYFAEVSCTDCTLLFAIAMAAHDWSKNRLVIFALTGDDVQIVYNQMTYVKSVESIERGKFHMTTSRGRIYEKGGQVWVEE